MLDCSLQFRWKPDYGTRVFLWIRAFFQHSFFRSSHMEVFCRKGVLRSFTKFTRKHQCQSLVFNKVADLRFFAEYIRTTATTFSRNVLNPIRQLKGHWYRKKSRFKCVQRWNKVQIKTVLFWSIVATLSITIHIFNGECESLFS